MARVSRRTLLLGGVAAAAVPAGVVAVHASRSRAEIAAGYIRQALPGLAVPDREIAAFAETYVGKIDPENQWRARYDAIFFMIANPSLEPILPARARRVYELETRHLLTTFLLSTDFFSAAGERPERTNFVAFSDPYALGCRNPIARFDA